MHHDYIIFVFMLLKGIRNMLGESGERGNQTHARGNRRSGRKGGALKRHGRVSARRSRNGGWLGIGGSQRQGRAGRAAEVDNQRGREALRLLNVAEVGRRGPPVLEILEADGAVKAPEPRSAHVREVGSGRGTRRACPVTSRLYLITTFPLLPLVRQQAHSQPALLLLYLPVCSALLSMQFGPVT